MLVRRIIAILAVVVVLVGLMEIVLPEWAITMSIALSHSVWLRLLGVLAAAVGVVLIVGYVKRLVGLRVFVLVLGIYLTVAGLFMFANPEFFSELLGVLLLNRRHSFQLTMLWASGLVRIAFGVALIYALARPPRPAQAG